MKLASHILPTGKLSNDLLARLLAKAPEEDADIVVGPGVGVDCAAVKMGSKLLVCKSDPITFATDTIGRYAVEVNANDLAVMGAIPRWLLVTLLLPEGRTTWELAEQITSQIYQCCRQMDVSVIGGHTEITHGLQRPIVSVTLLGEVEPGRLITSGGARPGDRLLLTKGVPIEATALLAREFPEALQDFLTPSELEEARNFLCHPGISILRDARTAVLAGQLSAMHDPTEGGLSGALWELAEASGHALYFDPARVPIPDLSTRICEALGINPLAALSSGALLAAASPEEARRIQATLQESGIDCAEIGEVRLGEPAVWMERGAGIEKLPIPERDEVARIFDRESDPSEALDARG